MNRSVRKEVGREPSTVTSVTEAVILAEGARSNGSGEFPARVTPVGLDSAAIVVNSKQELESAIQEALNISPEDLAEIRWPE